jgi:hypothetical protein
MNTEKWYNRIPTWGYVLISLGILLLTAIIEYMQGHVFISKSGFVTFWVGELNTPEGSQHISDWYTFSHIIHGFVFYWIIRLISRKKWPIWLCFVLALGIEVGWEILENSPLIINRYREATISLDYYGDSILNSICDVLFMALGFVLARKLPVWVTVTLIVLMEIGVGYFIRDNLILNIIMLVYPLEAIKTWQSGLGS